MTIQNVLQLDVVQTHIPEEKQPTSVLTFATSHIDIDRALFVLSKHNKFLHCSLLLIPVTSRLSGS
ncbi:7050_t:CDS:2 [Rhizophagus irregularis]|nr:7050_t:CDS:2 [Rhizophagus irregularis]